MRAVAVQEVINLSSFHPLNYFLFMDCMSWTEWWQKEKHLGMMLLWRIYIYTACKVEQRTSLLIFKKKVTLGLCEVTWREVKVQCGAVRSGYRHVSAVALKNEHLVKDLQTLTSDLSSTRKQVFKQVKLDCLHTCTAGGRLCFACISICFSLFIAHRKKKRNPYSAVHPHNKL